MPMPDNEPLPPQPGPALPGESLGRVSSCGCPWRLLISPAPARSGHRMRHRATGGTWPRALCFTFDHGRRFARCRPLVGRGRQGALGDRILGGPLPADRGPSRVGAPRAVPSLTGWLLSSVLRYCPDCLAGGWRAPSSQEYGGPVAEGFGTCRFTFACVRPPPGFLRQELPRSRTPADRPPVAAHFLSIRRRTAPPPSGRLPLKPGKNRPLPQLLRRPPWTRSG